MAFASALGVGSECLLQLIGEPEIIDDEPTRLVTEDPVHPSDCLHQPMPSHRLVGIHGMEAGSIESCQPHVPDDHDPERVLTVLESIGEFPALLLVADMLLPLGAIAGTAGHHDLHHTGFSLLGIRIVILGTSPVWAELQDRLVEIDADPAAHADDHCLPVHRLQTLLVVLHEIFGDQSDPLGITDECLQSGPLGLELLTASLLLALGDLLELLIQLRELRGIEPQLGDPALVVDRHRCLIGDRPLNVVDGDIIPEDRPGIGIGLLNRGPGESDKRCMGHRISHVTGEAVDQIILAPVGFVGDDDNIASVREGLIG